MSKSRNGIPAINPEELANISGIPGLPGKKSNSSIIDSVALKFAPKSSETKPATQSEHGDDSFWETHKKFAALHDTYGKPFARFVADILDIILTGSVQTRMINEMIEDRIARLRRKRVPANPRHTVPPKSRADSELEIGGEARQYMRTFLKRKSILAAVFLDREEFQVFSRIIKQVNQVCETSIEDNMIAADHDARRSQLEEILGSLKLEITPAQVMTAWRVLAADGFQNLEMVFKRTVDMHLVRPTFYADLDKAYREAKKLLKLLIAEFSENEVFDPEKQDAIQDYLQDILDVYTHHHFVLKFFNQTRPSVSRKDLEEIEGDLRERLDDFRHENAALRDAGKEATIKIDQLTAQTRALESELDVCRDKIRKLDPVEVERNQRAMEAKIKSIQKEHQATLEEDSDLRAAVRALDDENARLVQQLRELHAIPDETAYSVEGLLKGKHVAVFGGVGRDHYLPLLKEAGVSESDYEWFEGYHTISQSRTSDIVGRCDLVVIITSYAGHLLLYQVRSCIAEDKNLFLIHSSGAGSLRKKIIETYKKR